MFQKVYFVGMLLLGSQVAFAMNANLDPEAQMILKLWELDIAHDQLQGLQKEQKAKLGVAQEKLAAKAEQEARMEQPGEDIEDEDLQAAIAMSKVREALKEEIESYVSEKLKAFKEKQLYAGSDTIILDILIEEAKIRRELDQ